MERHSLLRAGRHVVRQSPPVMLSSLRTAAVLLEERRTLVRKRRVLICGIIVAKSRTPDRCLLSSS